VRRPRRGRPRAAHGARPADSLQRTLRISLPAAVAAGVHHPDVAQREVESDGIDRVDRAKRRRDLRRHPPPRRPVSRQTQALPEADHVRVERHDQLRRRDPRPRPEIHGVTAHHPAQEQVEALAAAPGGRTREEVAHARPLRHAPVRRAKIELQRAARKAVERRADVRRVAVVPFEEELFDRACPIEHLPQDPEERDEIAPARPPVHHAAKLGMRAGRIELAHESRRLGAEKACQRLHGVQHAGNTAERERSGAEADDFLIARRRISSNDLHRIGRRLLAIVGLIQIVQCRRSRSAGSDQCQNVDIGSPARHMGQSATG
jgi:hypothetical protein